jgi:hypothetical protein
MKMKGSVLNEHRVAGTISVQALKRTIRLTAQEKGMNSAQTSRLPSTNVLSEVAVGTIIADRPPHRSARALISACGSYLG